MDSRSIYERLGAERLQRLVDTFYDIVLKDVRINHLFNSDMHTVREKQFKFLSQFLGGPSLYSSEYGHPRMRMRHMPHNITADAAYAWLECMSQAVQSIDIDRQLQEDLFARFPQVAAHMVNR